MNIDNNISDLALIKSFKESNNQKLLGELYHPYKDLVFGLGLKYFKNRSDAEDLVGNVYEHINKKLKTHTVENFKSWLYVVTKNLCFERLRKESRTFSKENEAAIMYSVTVFHPDIEEDKQVLVRLKDCLNKLNDLQKQCIEDFYYKTMSYKKIAKLYNLPWNKVRSYIQNGRRMLKNCIEKNG